MTPYSEYPTNREFVKRFKHNNNIYTLRSIYDTENKFDFNNAIKYNMKTNTFNFDKAINQKLSYTPEITTAEYMLTVYDLLT